MRIFIDTWGWLVLRDRRESRHPEVAHFYQDFRRRKGTAYTSDYVLKELRGKFQDKPWISFTDLTSMVVMAECRIAGILTEDDHFLQVGMGFQKVP